MITLAARHTFEQEIKKSRFLAVAGPIDGEAGAQAFLERERDAAANHNCFAFKLGTIYRSSDDGEPGGSAGRPILAAIEGQGLDHVVVLVTRHFGGVKLGVGGLVRAYGGTAAECLRTAPRQEIRPRVRLLVQVPFELCGALFLVVEQLGVARLTEEYDAAGLALGVELDAALAERFGRLVADATRGRGRITPR